MPRHRIFGFCFLLLVLLPAAARAQSDDFDDGDDAGWLRYNPLGESGNTWSFPEGGYEIRVVPNPLQAITGAGRAGAIRTDTALTDFSVEADILPGWDPVKNAGFGLLARIQPGSIGLGNTDGYAFNYVQNGANLRLSRLTNETPANLTPPVPLLLDPERGYRFCFCGNGTALEGRVFQLPDLLHAIAIIRTTDATYSAGHGGILVFDNNGGGGAGATFDNYQSAPLRPQPPEICLEEGIFTATWPVFPRCLDFQFTRDPVNGSWQSPDPASVSYAADTGLFTFREPATSTGFFRLVPPLP